jgi:hypothetical protein
MRWLPWIFGAAVAAASLAARAQDEYQDRLIDSASLPTLPADMEAATYNPDGLPRQWRIEAFGSRIEGATIRHENGLALSARLDSIEYGAFTLDAAVRTNAGSNNVATLWQRGMPFEGGWRANNGVGTLNTPSIDLARQQFRFFVPTTPVLGAQTEWLNNNGVQLQAGIGEPGVYNGLRVAGFSRLGGTLATAGVQLALARDLTVGLQVADARNVGSELTDGSTKVDARSVFGAMAFGGPDNHWQLNFVDSQSGEGRHNLGVWLDGEFRDGRYKHNWGLFHFDPEVSWGYTPINRDVVGQYYRVDYHSQQWVWSAGVDNIDPVSDRGGSGAVFLTGNIRYQVDRSLGVGGGGTMRRAGTDAGSAYAFLDKQTVFGATRLQLDALAAEGGQQGQQITIDQGWPTQVGLRLSTAVSVGREKPAEGQRIRRASLSAAGGVDITNTLTIEGNIRWAVERQDARVTGIFANLGLVWRIAPRWSLLATYYDNRTDTSQFATIGPPLPVEPALPIPRDRAIFITVRYEDHAGTPTAPLGGAPGSGAGTLVGYVFYDANDDGRRGASESGAGNVTVLLDGRFGVRTDNNGKFEFPLVAAGPHAIYIVPDNLALPYSIPDEGKRSIIVRTRETTTLEIAARKNQ